MNRIKKDEMNQQLETKKDTSDINGWRQKTAELQKLLTERTADLLVKNKELEIEAALEKVRSRSLSMHKSDELKDVVAILFEKLKEIGLEFDGGAAIHVFKERTKNAEILVASSELETTIINNLPYDENEFRNNPIINDIWSAKETGCDIFNKYYSFEEKNKYFNYVFKYNDNTIIPEKVRQFIGNAESYTATFISEKNSLLGATSWTKQEFSKQDFDILKRFAKVFEQAYVRFLDLQKAEAQAREAQIEAALERVRSRSMAMQKSSELKEVIQVVYEQLVQLDMLVEHAGFIMDYKTRDDLHIWLADQHLVPSEVTIPWFDSMPNNSIKEAKENGRDSFKYLLTFEEKNKFYRDLFKFVPGVPEETLQYYFTCSGLAGSGVLLDNIGLYIENFSATPYSNQENATLMRFGKVFQQTYTRFLDLQNAEAQAREAQIEAALEKVRSRSLAMHHSNELEQVAGSLFDRLTELGLSFDGALILLFEKEKRNIELWIATVQLSEPVKIELPYDKEMESNVIINDLWHAIETGEHILNRTYSGTVKNDYFYYVQKYNKTKIPEAVRQLEIQNDWTICCVAEKNSIIGFDSWSGHLTSKKDFQVLIRFARVFEQAYIRFLDLQRAEAQAKEAKIEAALERIRGKAMAMHTTQDLSETVGAFYHELQSFSLTPIRCGVGLLEKEERMGELYTWYTTEKGHSLELAGRLKMEGHPVLNKVYESWLTQTEYHPVLRGNEIGEYYKILKPQMNFPDFTHNDVQFGYFFFFPEGGVYAWMDKEMQENELQIYRRFTSVLSLTYKRYRDLQKAEASAKEAVKQSALDHIRADIASMRTTKDLERITPLIWNELTILGVPFIRCGVFIMDDEEQQIHTFLSTPEGKGIAAFHLPYNSPGNISQVVSRWHKKEVYTDHWDKEAFKVFANNLVKQGAMKSSQQYLSMMPAVGLDLHFVPFQQGMLYVGNTAPLDNEEISLLQALADAFSTAYARYEDFNKLETAKKQIENALTELKQTQQQLIQSEKMASLGELTAGIAHEIQNPLNFVNNFSEVNMEMLEELKAERLKPDPERDENLQDELIQDVIENSEKISHHGKRADAIVKGMLQHSRKSSGQKEPTDINALADEYLRLSYHGLRAKDKSFNVTIETDFDPSIGKINIIPQDIGRVLLNLFNNAFYAVNKQKSKNLISYEPKVSVTTKKSENHVCITVRDNGNGIPENIIDKIFQPFFTTKPTGQGTGLGLSLSYDIIKVHGGETKVESEEGEGSEFIVQLPIV